MKIESDKEIWLRTEWSAIELDGKNVEFRIRIGNDLVPFCGSGVFRITENSEKLISIAIVVTQKSLSSDEMTDNLFYCPKAGAEKIEKSPAGSKFDFCLFEF